MYIQLAQKTLAQVLPFVPVFWLLDHQMQRIKKLLLEVSLIKDDMERKDSHIKSLMDRTFTLENNVQEHDKNLNIVAQHALALDLDVERKLKKLMQGGERVVGDLNKRMDKLQQERDEQWGR